MQLLLLSLFFSSFGGKHFHIVVFMIYAWLRRSCWYLSVDYICVNAACHRQNIETATWLSHVIQYFKLLTVYQNISGVFIYDVQYIFLHYKTVFVNFDACYVDRCICYTYVSNVQVISTVNVAVSVFCSFWHKTWMPSLTCCNRLVTILLTLITLCTGVQQPVRFHTSVLWIFKVWNSCVIRFIII